ncbi:Uncharacterised protein [Mycobacteroides abscessus subsp. abscessus]|nr:Uncharacterised protein [Mycobacteroides abscessus subsp. abscessus]
MFPSASPRKVLPPRHHPRAREPRPAAPGSTHRWSLRSRRHRHPGTRRTALPPVAHSARNRPFPKQFAAPARLRSGVPDARRNAATAHCRRASSRSAAPPRPHPRCTARNLRPTGHRCHRAPSPRRCGPPRRARRHPRCARTPATAPPAEPTAETWAPHRNPRNARPRPGGSRQSRYRTVRCPRPVPRAAGPTSLAAVR